MITYNITHRDKDDKDDKDDKYKDKDDKDDIDESEMIMKEGIRVEMVRVELGWSMV